MRFSRGVIRRPERRGIAGMPRSSSGELLPSPTSPGGAGRLGAAWEGKGPATKGTGITGEKPVASGGRNPVRGDGLRKNACLRLRPPL